MSGGGYLHARYAESLSEFGAPLQLVGSEGWLLRREIERSQSSDAANPYPLFLCVDWSRLTSDLQSLGDDIVSVTLVSDPFAPSTFRSMAGEFDHFALFKQHYVIDLTGDPHARVATHHRRYARAAMRELDVEIVPEPVGLVDEWCRLYAGLVERHHISGMRAFSRNAFEKQLRVPGVVMFRASLGAKTVAMLLCYVTDDRAYYHLGASSDEGYELRASFALFWRAIDCFGERGLKWLSLGAGAGITDEQEDGLTRFKSGWSKTTLPVFVCGRIQNRAEYERLSRATDAGGSAYFPRYRANEFRP